MKVYHEEKAKMVKRLALLLLLFCPVAYAAPTITVSASSITILGTNQTISLTCTLIDPNSTGMLRNGAGGVITVFVTNTVTPGNTATCGPVYGNDIITDGFGNVNSTYYKVQVFTVDGSGVIASTPSLQQFYAFTGSGTIDLATATPLAPSFMTGTNGSVSIPGNVTISGNLTATAGQNIGKFYNIDNVLMADGNLYAPGSDIGAMLQTMVAALPASGGTIDCRGLQGSFNATSNQTFAKSGVTYLFGPNQTIAFTAGVQWTFSGSDLLIKGAGDTTVLDASAGTSATTTFLIRGNRTTITGFKFIGNRVAGGTATILNCNPAAGTIDRCVVTRNTFTNAGGAAISVTNGTNAQASYNNISSSNLSGVFLDTTGAGHRLLFNTVTDSNLSNVAGHGGLSARDAGTPGNQTDVKVIGNQVRQTTTALGNAVGIDMNGVVGLEVSNNTVYQTTGSGEGIAVTAKNATISGNNTLTNAGAPASCGILLYVSANSYDSAVISGNVSKDGSSSMCMAWGANNVTIQDVNIYGNRSYGNSNYGFQTFSGFAGMILGANVLIHDNDFNGNLTSPMNLLTAGVTGTYSIWNNKGDTTALSSSILGAPDLTRIETMSGKTFTSPTINLLTNGTGAQLFNTTTTCTTGASIGATCTTAAITLPVAEADTNYRIVCTGKGLTNVPVVIATTNSSATQFTITIAALTAAAASFASYDCHVGHN